MLKMGGLQDHHENITIYGQPDYGDLRGLKSKWPETYAKESFYRMGSTTKAVKNAHSFDLTL